MRPGIIAGPLLGECANQPGGGQSADAHDASTEQGLRSGVGLDDPGAVMEHARAYRQAVRKRSIGQGGRHATDEFERKNRRVPVLEPAERATCPYEIGPIAQLVCFDEQSIPARPPVPVRCRFTTTWVLRFRELPKGCDFRTSRGTPDRCGGWSSGSGAARQCTSTLGGKYLLRYIF